MEDLTLHFDYAMRDASRAQDSTGISPTALLDELQHTVNPCVWINQPQPHWRMAIHGNADPCEICPETFLQWAAMRGLFLYVKAKIGQSDDKEYLLYYATVRTREHKPVYPLSPQTVKVILQAGADPNHKWKNSTPWTRILGYLYSSTIGKEDPDVDQGWVDVCKLLILYGADLRAQIAIGTDDVKASAIEVLETAFIRFPRHPVQELLEILAERGSAMSRKRRGRHSDCYRPAPYHRSDTGCPRLRDSSTRRIVSRGRSRR